MKITDERSFTLRFSEEPIAQPAPGKRYCLFLDTEDGGDRLEVLAHKSSAHRVAQAAIALGLQWRLIFDEQESPYVILEFAAPLETLSPMIKKLTALRYSRSAVSFSDVAARRPYIPHAFSTSSAPASSARMRNTV